MEVIINQVSFSLPCKAFIVDYSVSEKRQLPVVKEFIVRLLFSVGSCKPTLLSDFFGFSSDELQYVLSDLTEEGLIKWTDKTVVLTSYAQEKFEEIAGGKLVPRFFEIEDEIDTVLFDLYSFKILYSSFKQKSRNPLGVDIPLADGSHSNIKEKIKSSFGEQFSLYQEKVQGIDIYKNFPELYKINHITTNYDAVLPIEISYSINKDSPKNIILKYNSEVIDEWDSQHILFKPMDEALLGENNSDDCVKEFSDYTRLTNDPFITKYWTPNNNIDIDSLINNYAVEHNIWDSKSTRMLIGNIYTKNNSAIIMKMIREKRQNEHSDNKITKNGAIWIAEPENKTWGRTSEFISFVTEINELFDQRKKSTGIAMIIPCASKQESWELQDLYSFSTENKVKLQGVNEVFISKKIEIFYIPNIIMVTLFHYHLEDDRKLTLPIGFITTNSGKMIKINSEIGKWINSEKIANDFLEDKGKKNTVLSTLIQPTIEILEAESG